ncbi:MAG: hypothetical protein K2G04_03045, partial [Oscillospiraceae bacterium]|nr:hypothetical protein [Oscillospiraceae bacterium]
MKYKIFFSVILSAMLFTACNLGSPADNTPADVPSAELEIQTESSPETTLETETEETETTPEVTEAAEETAEISGTTSSEYFDYFTFDLGKFEAEPVVSYTNSTHRECTLLSKSLLCAIYQYQEPDQARQHYLRIYDIERNEMLANIL